MKFSNTLRFAKQMDVEDPLRSFRKEFLIPAFNGKKTIYFTGNSLGLQPKTVRTLLLEELDDWGALGVDAHFRSRRPWVYYHKFTKQALAQLAGARQDEVIAMNQLTINLHLMMATFFRPNAARFKILVEDGAFSSDQYALESQLKLHGLDPENALIELKPRDGESALRTDEIIRTIAANKTSLSLVLFGGVQYYSGQFFDIKKITDAAHRAGAFAGFDLAHAIGNVPLSLHNDNVDFAVWCSYKYLNSGPGAIAGAFIHKRHGDNLQLPRMAGWWGHDERKRFEMKKGFRPMPGADGWQVSNVPIFQAAAHLAALEIFQRAGMKSLRKKSVLLTGYLEFLLLQFDPHQELFHILTPAQHADRGCQLSLFIHRDGKRISDGLSKLGVVTDWREPGVVRVAPVPLYNTFEEVYRFVEILKGEFFKLKNPRKKI
jgi:kynureninase